MAESSQTPPAPSKSKAFLDYFRSKDAVATDDAKGSADPAPKTTDEPPAVDSTDKPKSLTSTQIEKQWDETIAGAKARETLFSKLKRLGSKDGKSGKSKGKEKEKVPEEPAIEDLAAMIPLPAEDNDTPKASTPNPVTTPPANSNTTPGANTLSKRIQVMLSSVPPFLHTVPDTVQSAPSPVPPLADAKLLGYLSSPEVMNGSPPVATPGGNQRRSVWQVLDQLVPYKPPTVPAAGDEDPEEEASETSLMICAPLIPNADSKVELAQSAVVSIPDVEPDVPNISGKAIAKGVAASLWPDKLKFPWGKKKKDCDDDDTPAPAPAPAPPAKPTKEVKIWIPSKTEISFQVAWWGYRLWLPEPVMAILSDKTLEASKRAAMIATAIGWLINNIPTAILPAPLKTAVTLLKAVLPLLGYISGFIAWSWAEVKSFDKGNGVVLSATWLLPIALIPGSWEDQYESLPIGKGEEQPVTNTPGAPATNPGTSTPANPGTSTPANPGTTTPANPGTSTPANPGTSTPANPGTSTPASGTGKSGKSGKSGKWSKPGSWTGPAPVPGGPTTS